MSLYKTNKGGLRPGAADTLVEQVTHPKALRRGPGEA